MAIQLILEEEFNLVSEKALNGLEGFEQVKLREKHLKEYPCTCGNKSGNDNYQLIFMDCNMPIMDGIESTKKIKEYLK